ncbi:hypothetical protein K469DRAFT_801851 [Zopfia rhizophila CBS 207.26]|uniref:Uncharacterized protein n=1 Tax=Zopfia rhizophila CBS 207.26 TaxID=1314779 RepID=A0A6A6DL23_9PEZI|nr:hypothetical protein K469DRAFT_801851 [Zopfia rhizophila CBS 207.26]
MPHLPRTLLPLNLFTLVLLACLPTTVSAQPQPQPGLLPGLPHNRTPPSTYHLTTYSWHTLTSLIAPLPCSGYCSSDFCACPNGTVVWNLPVEPCVSQNPFWPWCPGNILQELCCSGRQIFGGEGVSHAVMLPKLDSYITLQYLFGVTRHCMEM